MASVVEVVESLGSVVVGDLAFDGWLVLLFVVVVVVVGVFAGVVVVVVVDAAPAAAFNAAWADWISPFMATMSLW